MWITLAGRRWLLRFVTLKTKFGDCDPPETPRRQIRIHAGLRGEERLRYCLHEMAHASFWQIDETVVDDATRDIAAVLWRLGYRHPTDTRQ